MRAKIEKSGNGRKWIRDFNLISRRKQCSRSSWNVRIAPGLLEHDLDGEIETHPVAFPARYWRLNIRQPAPVTERLRASRRDAVDRVAVRLHEPQRAIVEDLDADAAFVHRAVVKPAEGSEILQLRLTAIGPVLDVMRVEVARVRATGKAAAFIACVEH